MTAEIKLAIGKNNRLYSITTRLSNICVKYLAFNKNPQLNFSEQDVIDKGIRYLNEVSSGLAIKNTFKNKKFSFDHKTIESLYALQIILTAKKEDQIDDTLIKVKNTLNAIKNRNAIEDDSVEQSIQFFNALSNAVSNESYNAEASHIL